MSLLWFPKYPDIIKHFRQESIRIHGALWSFKETVANLKSAALSSTSYTGRHSNIYTGHSNILLSTCNTDNTSSPSLPFKAIGYFLSYDCLSSALLEVFCYQDEGQTVTIGQMTSYLHFPHIWMTGEASQESLPQIQTNKCRKRRGCTELNPLLYYDCTKGSESNNVCNI